MKSLFKSLLVAAVATAILINATTVSAQDKAKEKDKAAEKTGEKAKGGGFTGKAVAVDKAAKTVKLSGEKGRTLQISATTKIAKDGKPGTLDDLKEGDDVFGGYKIGADGKLEATSLSIGKAPAKKKDEKKDEKK